MAHLEFGRISSRWSSAVNFAYEVPPTGSARNGVIADDLRLHELDSANCTRPTQVVRIDGDFNKRIQQRFPAGSDEAVLVTELREERFSIDETRDSSGTYRHLAHYKRQDIACRTSWDVLWSGEQGRIVTIEGRYSGDICL